MKLLLKNLIVWLWLLSSSLIAVSCVSSRPSKLELQKRDSTIAFNASKISDADAAVIAYDMLNACEKSLADSTFALQKTRKSIPRKVRKAKWQGVGMGVLGISLMVSIIRVFL